MTFPRVAARPERGILKNYHAGVCVVYQLALPASSWFLPSRKTAGQTQGIRRWKETRYGVQMKSFIKLDQGRAVRDRVGRENKGGKKKKNKIKSPVHLAALPAPRNPSPHPHPPCQPHSAHPLSLTHWIDERAFSHSPHPHIAG
jgi:hypothetical protein